MPHSEHRFDFLDSLAGGIESLNLPSKVASLLATRIEEALADPRSEPLNALQEQLRQILSVAFGHAPEAVVANIRGRTAHPSDSGIAYDLGQLSFAQSLTSRAWEKRADDAFFDAIRSETARSIVRALYLRPLSSSDLASEINERPETVSRKLKRLRELGICDFRREGTVVINFLTPAAQSVADGMRLQPNAVPKPNKKLKLILKDQLDALDSQWLSAPNFSAEEPTDEAMQA